MRDACGDGTVKHIDAAGIRSIASALKKNTTITTVNLYSVRFGQTCDAPDARIKAGVCIHADGARHIARMLEVNSTITAINLAGERCMLCTVHGDGNA